MTSQRGGAPADRIRRAILLVRGQRVMLDADLAMLYNVSTGALVQAVQRNLSRFPEDFMFRLTRDETAALRSQSVISNAKPGGVARRTRPSSRHPPHRSRITAEHYLALRHWWYSVSAVRRGWFQFVFARHRAAAASSLGALVGEARFVISSSLSGPRN
jgi:hypothetical protein